jgi:ribosomal protein L37E
MLKLVEIAKSWIAAADPTPEQQKIADYRISVCEECPQKSFQKHINIFICGNCGCPLEKKVYSPLPGEEACPEARWKK